MANIFSSVSSRGKDLFEEVKFCSGAVRSDHKSDARCNFLFLPRNVIIPQMRSQRWRAVDGWIGLE